MKLGLRELIFVAMLLGVPVGLYMYVLKPRKVAKEAMVVETKHKSEQLQKMKFVRLQAEQKIREDIKFLEKALEIIRTKQPVAEAPNKTRTALSQLSLKYNLRDFDFMDRKIFASEPKEKQYAIRGITVNVSGAYRNFYAFLLELESGTRVIRINKMTLNAIKKEGQNGSVEATLFMSVLSPKNKDQKK